ncbi:peptidyl-prolyl cis-trans isomerase [Parabacteroides sp. AD58]|uniref:Peptidyl-prolyl cis-trans isomerase n=1 Tax=Parabacteroides absconsus TaxID=2951805 RepID=A0ABZ2IGS9_9BACT|nr:peptidyl-prolyl cis-trans isomerase [Parabacteroides sp. AD58]MCM6903300.1 peptidyl-prolyl cis-trans isomerase [Parabacteroides sp. AD58]
MRTGFYIFFSLLLLGGCTQKGTTELKGVLVKVNERALTKDEVLAVLPKNMSSADSLLWAESYIKQWIKDGLVYDVALQNLDDDNRAEIDRLVDSYRRSLVRYRYQEQLIQERLSANITEEEKQKFYEENQDQFILDHSLVKGLFLKIPIDAPNLSEVKKWYRSTSESAIEKIEKYSVQNAMVYDYFYDKWVSFDEVSVNIPIKVTNETEFLRTHSFVETADSSYCYLLNIEEYIAKGKIAPFEYASKQISDMLVNQRKVQFLKNFEEELYNDAIRAGNVVFTKEMP